ncbi:hydantoinase/carbamoylase family amidase [Afifella sp. JA880]|uniref:hydantoinase/carbamoylase family amidase n=1 Tax=Afifella sp. JA880 TaxID=2975280 RepID=UPI0021BAD69B|nr:hydantoinase/carbamoylase family amidase [Afifella sp. JA880]MCT8267259.1 hydantoinase/carbamoylase family amidase [Afifella sp. JA880]
MFAAVGAVHRSLWLRPRQNEEPAVVEIKSERLIADLRRLAEFGKYKTGVDRIAFSLADVASRDWLKERLSEIGLVVKQDRFGNVYGAWPDVDRALLLGSHSDTVPRGGWLDGAMGVIYALEVARAFRESGTSVPVGIDVIAFQDEEGTYLPLLGSKSLAGLLSEGDVGHAHRSDGEALTSAIASAGFSGDPIVADRRRLIGFLEGHIEQGPRLLAAGRRIGIVTGFAGTRRMSVKAEGRADHAGTTPMTMRRDAGRAIFAFASWVDSAFLELSGAETVWNIGSVALRPGAPNVVPSQAELALEFRDGDLERLERMESAVHDKAAGLQRETGLAVSVDVTTRVPPTMTNAKLAGELAEAAADLGEQPMRLASGAGHDCMIIGQTMPAAMFFVPSIGGRSHDIDEDTAEEDIVFGCRMLARTVERLISNELP